MAEFKAGDLIKVTYTTRARQRAGDREPFYFGQWFRGLGFEEILSHSFEVVKEESE